MMIIYNVHEKVQYCSEGYATDIYIFNKLIYFKLSSNFFNLKFFIPEWNIFIKYLKK